jgi:hypothetical protein
MTAVDHTRDRHLITQGTQAACGWILHILLTQQHRVTGEDLPVLTWVIRDEAPRLAGQARTAEDLEAWASHLDVTVTRRLVHREVRMEAAGTVDGIEIHLWTHRIPKNKAVA